MTMISVTNDKMQIYFPSMVYSGMGAGQGVAQAFEDAVHLAHAIQEGGLTPQSLRAFEAKVPVSHSDTAWLQVKEYLKHLRTPCTLLMPSKKEG